MGFYRANHLEVFRPDLPQHKAKQPEFAERCELAGATRHFLVSRLGKTWFDELKAENNRA